MTKKLVSFCICFLIAMFIASELIAQTANENVLIILDLSKSMGETLSQGETKFEIAKRAVNEVINSLPPEVKVGLRVYGHKSGLLGMNQCHKTDLLAPIASNNRDKIISEIEKLAPNGVTLIEYSLRKGIDDFKGIEGPKRIVLISDGIETCNGDPCNFARKLRYSGQDIKVDVISFGKKLTNFSPDSQLQCIATATNGTFNRASTQIDLVKAINNSFKIDTQVHWAIRTNY